MRSACFHAPESHQTHAPNLPRVCSCICLILLRILILHHMADVQGTMT